MTREIGDIINLWQSHRDEPLVLATLVRTQGSSYRLPGARMLVTGTGKSAGSLSGGCLEEEVVQRALEVMGTAKPFVMHVDTRLRFGCHGEITIFLEPVSPSFLSKLAELQGTRQPGWAATNFEVESPEAGTRWLQVGEILREGEFGQEICPPIQLLVVGDGPDCAALRQLSEALGWTWRHFESASEISGGFDEWTAALVKTHNYGRDFAALRALLPLNLRYVGLLGPRRRREQLLGDLLDTDVPIPDHFYAPAGQVLGGDSPESIALAVIAEIHAVFAGRPGNHLRDLATPIHPDRSQQARPEAISGGIETPPLRLP